MTAVIYARYSSDMQTEQSIDAQVRACKEYASKKNIIVTKIYPDEAISGTTANRVKYQEMLADAFDNKFDVILIHKYDRIARNLEEQVTLRSKLKSLNIKLIAVAQDYGEGKDAELSKGIQWVLGEYYSANLAEETKKGHREVALKGLHNGGVAPFGYDIVDQKYIINEQEAYYVKWMFEACLSGTGYTDIIDSLKANDIIGKRGKEIKYTQIYEILHNEKYTGTYVYSIDEETDRADRRTKPNAIRIENAIPAIIDKNTFDQVQNIMSSRKNGKRFLHRCSGLVYCSECGAKMHLYNTKRKGHEYHNFRCSAKCGAHGVPVEFVDEAVDAYLNEMFSEKNKEEVEAALTNLYKYNKSSSESFYKAQNRLLEQRKEELNNLINALASGKFNDNLEFCNELITQKRLEIENIKTTKPELIKDSQIRDWMENIINSNYAPKAFIDRIEANTTSIRILSSLTEVVGQTGCGGSIDILPTTMFSIRYPRRYPE